MPEPATTRVPAGALLDLARGLLGTAGLAADRAHDVAEVLLEGDLLGHTTHGLTLLPLYVKEIRDGTLTTAGDPVVVSDHGSTVTWDGRYLPGPWLVRRAIAQAHERLAGHPTAMVVIGRSHHIACLQAFLKPVVDRGLFILLTCSDPAGRWVAPPGSVQAVYTPNPVAAGIPTADGPMLIDISLSTTSVSSSVRTAKAGGRVAGPWLVDAAGHPTDDPSPLVNEKSGALYPLGGADLGYKGFALGLIVEALTSGLAGHGRADSETRWGASVFLMLIDPAGFGGRDAFVRETTFLADACRAAAVPAGQPPVRLPGDQALRRRANQLANGVALHPDILAAMRQCARELSVPVPTPLS